MNKKILERKIEMKETFFWDFSQEDISTLSDLTSEGFEFDWTAISSPNAITSGFVIQGEVSGMIEFTPEPTDYYNFIHKLEVRMDKRNQGIAGVLLAYVAKDAFNRGFEGFMMLISKTALRDFYVSRYGGSRIGNTNRVIFNTAASQGLIDRFLKGGLD